jgi:hypothetical protein
MYTHETRCVLCGTASAGMPYLKAFQFVSDVIVASLQAFTCRSIRARRLEPPAQLAMTCAARGTPHRPSSRLLPRVHAHRSSPLPAHTPARRPPALMPTGVLGPGDAAGLHGGGRQQRPDAHGQRQPRQRAGRRRARRPDRRGGHGQHAGCGGERRGRRRAGGGGGGRADGGKRPGGGGGRGHAARARAAREPAPRQGVRQVRIWWSFTGIWLGV